MLKSELIHVKALSIFPQILSSKTHLVTGFFITSNTLLLDIVSIKYLLQKSEI